MELVVVDAARLGDGPVCSIALPHHLPLPMAATWTRAYLGPGRAAPPGWRPRAAEPPPAGAAPTDGEPQGAGQLGQLGAGPEGLAAIWGGAAAYGLDG